MGMYVLDKLWRGKLSPSEQCCNYGSEYSNLSSRLYRMSKQLAGELSEDGKKLFREYQSIQEQMSAISEEDVFVNGFRIGVGLFLDAIGTYESQFVRYHED
jgi:hypothetical protein